MLETRPIWIVVLVLNACVLIWFISVQQPVMLNVSTTSITISNSFSNIPANVKNIDQSTSNRYVKKKHLLFQHTFLKNNNENLSDATLLTFSSEPTKNDVLTIYERNATLVKEEEKELMKNGMKSSKLIQTLPRSDFGQLIDLTGYNNIMSQPECEAHVEALILIHSAPNNQGKRRIIRETWGKIVNKKLQRNPLRLIFLLGAVRSSDLQRMLEAENSVHADMVQGSFIDDYRNMTYKHVMAFKWFLYNCGTAQILIKVDDDVYVNTLQLLYYAKAAKANRNNATTPPPSIKPSTITTTNNSLFEQTTSMYGNSSEPSPQQLHKNFDAQMELFHQPRGLLFCKPYADSLVKRSYRSKWRVSFKEYRARYYPPYCPGYAIIYSPDIVYKLYKAAQKSKYFWIDDVHITGILAQSTNTPITTSSRYVLSRERFNQILAGQIDLNDEEFLFAWHGITSKSIYELWSMQVLKYVVNEVSLTNHFVFETSTTTTTTSYR